MYICIYICHAHTVDTSIYICLPIISVWAFVCVCARAYQGIGVEFEYSFRSTLTQAQAARGANTTTPGVIACSTEHMYRNQMPKHVHDRINKTPTRGATTPGVNCGYHPKTSYTSSISCQDMTHDTQYANT